MESVEDDVNLNIIRCSDNSEIHSSNNEKLSLSNQIPLINSKSPDATAVSDVNYSRSSILSSACQEKVSAIEEPSDCPAAGLVSSSTCNLQFGKGKDDGWRDATVNDASNGVEVMDVDNLKVDLCRNVQTENCGVSSYSTLSASNRKEAPGGNNDNKDHPEIDLVKMKGLGPVNIDDSSRVVKAKADNLLVQKSKMHFEHEDTDVLEIAWQVGIQVEQKVAEHRETTFSSPEVHSGHTGTSYSPALEEAKQDQPVIGKVDGSKSSAVKGYYTGSASSLKEDDSGITENISFSGEKDEPHLESSISNVSAQESVAITDRYGCEFDLNANICTEELGYLVKPAAAVPIHVSAPIPAVVSKGLLLPVTSLHFEGELGWNGTAVTSAFQPVYPRRTPDVEKTSSGLMQTLSFLGVDLNVTETEDDVVIEPAPLKLLPVSSNLPCGGSSMEISMGVSKRLNLDLNHLADEESIRPSLHSNIGPQNGDQSVSSVSSSCPRQPAVRDFDLNNNPSFLDAGGSNIIDKSCLKASNTYNGPKLDNPTIMIMGSRVMVGGKDYANHMQKSFLDNERNMDSAVAATFSLPYAHVPPFRYGHTGLNTGSAMCIPSSFYGSGSTPYMFGSRGNTAMGSGLSSAPSMSREGGSFRQFLLQGHNQLMQESMRNIPQPSTSESASFKELLLQGYGGFMQESMRNISQPSTSGRESSREFLLQGHNGLMQELTRNISQPNASGTTLKRKKPECGWDPYGSD
ncbi:uncharacterized protein [Typha latifolia]|uniref:uncharacterized protein n=1 Tax=Typha latifolia TaxID=4733 RepID=UPI003C30C0D2